jgi:RHS repeat-associated protein
LKTRDPPALEAPLRPLKGPKKLLYVIRSVYDFQSRGCPHMGYSLIYEQSESAIELSVSPCPRRVAQKVDGAPFYRIILSSKYWDGDTKLHYYGYRYYSPGMGRWANRDTIREKGGANINCFVNNNSIDKVDYLGMLSHELSPHGLSLGIAGEFSYWTLWKLDKKYKETGTLIQRMRKIYEVKDYKGNILSQKDYGYTEAWTVMADQDRTEENKWTPPHPVGDYNSFEWDDLFRFDQQGLCTVGWAHYIGEAEFYEGVDSFCCGKPFFSSALHLALT